MVITRFVWMICRHKLYHFTVANTRITAPLTRRDKTKFATIKWYNLCLQIIQSQTCYPPSILRICSLTALLNELYILLERPELLKCVLITYSGRTSISFILNSDNAKFEHLWIRIKDLTFVDLSCPTHCSDLNLSNFFFCGHLKASFFGSKPLEREGDQLLNVTCNDIIVIYVTPHGCAGGMKKFDLRSGSQRHNIEQKVYKDQWRNCVEIFLIRQAVEKMSFWKR